MKNRINIIYRKSNKTKITKKIKKNKKTNKTKKNKKSKYFALEGGSNIKNMQITYTNTNTNTNTNATATATATINSIITLEPNNKNLTSSITNLQNEPIIEISNLLDNESYIMLMHDPNAPIGNWLHWLYIQTGNTNANRVVLVPYMGPKPPAGSGRHNYIFNIYSIDTKDKDKEILKIKMLLQNPGNSKINSIRGNQTLLNGLMNYIKTKKIMAETKTFFIDS